MQLWWGCYFCGTPPMNRNLESPEHCISFELCCIRSIKLCARQVNFILNGSTSWKHHIKFHNTPSAASVKVVCFSHMHFFPKVGQFKNTLFFFLSLYFLVYQKIKKSEVWFIKTLICFAMHFFFFFSQTHLSCILNFLNLYKSEESSYYKKKRKEKKRKIFKWLRQCQWVRLEAELPSYI